MPRRGGGRVKEIKVEKRKSEGNLKEVGRKEEKGRKRNQRSEKNIYKIFRENGRIEKRIEWKKSRKDKRMRIWKKNK